MTGAMVGGAMTTQTINSNLDAFITHLIDEANLGSYTFSATPLGLPQANRVVVVCALGIGANTTACTIDGSAMTNQGNVVNRAVMFSLAWPTGATGDIVVTTATGTAMAIAVYAIYPASATALDTANLQATATSVSATDVQCAIGGRLIWMSKCDAAPSIAASWNGVDAVVTQFNGINGNSARGAFGHIFNMTEAVTTNDLVITADASAVLRVVATSWGA